MKKVLILGVLSLLLVSVFSCKDDDDSNERSLAIESKRLTVNATAKQSLFDPVKFVLNIPIGSVIEDSKYGSNITYKLDSTAFYHRNDTGAVKRVAGALSFIGSDTLMFTPNSRLFLNEEYYFYVYCSYYTAKGNLRVVENGSNVTVARWVKYVPTVVPDEDVRFSTTMNGKLSDIVNPYNGDLIVDFEVPLLFTDSLDANDDIALLYRSMKITSNSGDEYVSWNLSIDTVNGQFNYLPTFPEDRANMIAGVYYTINLQYDYLVNEGGKWVNMMNSYGDTATWNYNKAFKTDDLFTPKKIITDAFPTGGNVVIDTVPSFYFSESHLKTITKNGIAFRNKLISLDMTDGVRDYTNYQWLKKGESSAATSDSVVLKFSLDSMLLPTTNYDVHVEAKWQFLKDTTWFDIVEEDTIKREIIDIAIATNNPSPGKGTFVAQMPINGSVDVSMNPEVTVQFSSPIGSEIRTNGLEMRSMIESFSVSSAQAVVGDKYSVSDDKQVAKVVLDSLLNPIAEYSAIILVNWEYKDINGTWKEVTKNAGKNYIDADTISFTTFNVPSSVVKQITPTKSRIDLDSKFGISLVGSTSQIITKGGVDFRPVFLDDEVSVKMNNIEIDGTGSMVGDSAYLFTPDSMLYAGSSYIVSLKSYWEFKDGDRWRAVKVNGGIKYENVAKVIRTATSPGSLITSLTPNRAGTRLDDSVVVEFRSGVNEEIDFAGTVYKIVAEDPIVTLDSDTVSGQYISSGDSIKMFIPDTYFNTSSTYSIKASSQWMYKRNEKWFSLGVEDKSTTFTTLGVPGSVFGSITPANKSYVSVTTVPTVSLAGDVDVEFNSVKYKRVIDKVYLLKNDVVLDSVYTVANNIASLNLTNPLSLSTAYSVKAFGHWEYQLIDGSWRVAIISNSSSEESMVSGFTTNSK